MNHTSRRAIYTKVVEHLWFKHKAINIQQKVHDTHTHTSENCYSSSNQSLAPHGMNKFGLHRY